MALITISRQLLPLEHRILRNHIPETNRLGDLSIKWRRLGEAGVTLVERGIAQRAVGKAVGRLATMQAAELAEMINKSVLTTMPGGNDRLSVPVTNISFFGTGPFRSVAYTVDSAELEQQRTYITAGLDRRNGVNSDWGNFEPHITLATVPSGNMSDDILDTFWGFAPDRLTLLPAIAKTR